MAIYGAVRKDKLSAGHAGNLESVKHTADMENGMIVHIGGLSTGEREIKDVVVPTAGSITSDPILLIATPELTYYAGETLVNFVNPAGQPALAYHLNVGDIVTITDSVLDGTTVVGQYVAPQAGSLKFKTSATAPSTRFVGKIIEKTTLYGQPATAIQVVAH